jgi:membrane-bound hydrogenase subunit alpha
MKINLNSPVGSSVFQAPVGPAHPALKEPVMFSLELDGERIKSVDFEPGKTHRGIEWMGTRRNAIQTLYVCERICGICGIVHTCAYCRAIEQIMGLEVPPRAYYIRTIVCELERIHSHLLWAGVAAHVLGFDSLFYLAWRVRERVMDTLEYISGNRVHYGTMQIGGVNRDIRPDQYAEIRESIAFFSSVYDELARLFLEDSSVIRRCRDCGVLTHDDALKLAAVGPTGRASGVAKDVRQDIPYSAYADFPVKAVTPDQLTGEVHGDIYDRIIVRLMEVTQAIDIIEKCLDNMPDGPVLAEPNMIKLLRMIKQAEGEATGYHEAPRGEVVHFVRLEKRDGPTQWKVRAPTYNNMMPWVPMMVGEQIADVPIIASSIDPCMSCTDRVATIRNGKREILTKEDLHKLSIEKTRRLQNAS